MEKAGMEFDSEDEDKALNEREASGYLLPMRQKINRH